MDGWMDIISCQYVLFCILDATASHALHNAIAIVLFEKDKVLVFFFPFEVAGDWKCG